MPTNTEHRPNWQQAKWHQAPQSAGHHLQEDSMTQLQARCSRTAPPQRRQNWCWPRSRIGKSRTSQYFVVVWTMVMAILGISRQLHGKIFNVQLYLSDNSYLIISRVLLAMLTFANSPKHPYLCFVDVSYITNERFGSVLWHFQISPTR